MSILLGVNAFPASGEAGRRQIQALAAWRGLRGVALANLQWADDVCDIDGFDTAPVLVHDARTVTGIGGRPLPLVSECFDRLAALARDRGLRWFGYANSDITLTQGAVDRVIADGREGYAFSRMDVDPETRADVKMVTEGVDAFVIGVDWWRRNRRRFRAYLGGEPIWDNVYTAILLAHADAVLLNRDALVLHERHPPGDWRGSPYARYLNYLAALDSPYFSLWAVYHDRLLGLRGRGAGEPEEMELQREIFRRRPSALDRAVHAGRVVKARARWITRSRKPA